MLEIRCCSETMSQQYSSFFKLVDIKILTTGQVKYYSSFLDSIVFLFTKYSMSLNIGLKHSNLCFSLFLRDFLVSQTTALLLCLSNCLLTTRIVMQAIIFFFKMSCGLNCFYTLPGNTTINILNNIK